MQRTHDIKTVTISTKYICHLGANTVPSVGETESDPKWLGL